MIANRDPQMTPQQPRRRTTRRTFLRQGAAFGALLALAPSLDAVAQARPRIAPSLDSTASYTVRASPRAAQPTTITLWHSLGDVQGTLGATFMRHIEGYNASQSSVIVKPESVAPSYNALRDKIGAEVWAAKQGRTHNLPDVALTMDARSFARWGELYPLDNLASQTGLDLSDFIEGLINDCRYGEEEALVCLPAARSLPLLYYNVAMFDPAGSGTDRDPLQFFSSWDNVAATGPSLLPALTPGVPRPLYSFPISRWFLEQIVWTFGGEMVGADGRAAFNQPEAARGVRFLADMVHRHGVAKTFPYDSGFVAWDASRDLLITQQTAVSAQSSAQLNRMLSSTEITVGVAPLPGKMVDGKLQRAVSYGGANLAIMGRSQHPEAAMDFLSWFTSPDITVQWHAQTGYLPVRVSASQLPSLQETFAASPFHRVLFEQAAVARATPAMDSIPLFEPEVVKNLFEAILLEGTGSADVQAHLDAAAVTADALWEDWLKVQPQPLP